MTLTVSPLRFLFCLIEAIEDFDGFLRGFIAEYDRAGRFLRCTRLHTRFQKANKGFEGLAHAWRGGREHLYALCESNLGRSAEGGRIDEVVVDSVLFLPPRLSRRVADGEDPILAVRNELPRQRRLSGP